MFFIGDSSLLTQYDALSEREQRDLPGWFASRGGEGILHMGGGLYHTAKTAAEGGAPLDLRVRYGPDMFLDALRLDTEYAAAGDGENPDCVLQWRWLTYTHAYACTGYLDMRLLNQYQCVFLYDCNEFSVELVRTAFRYWQGQRLVLVGETWASMIPLLPDLEAACYYEPQLSAEGYSALARDLRSLHIVPGMPHREPLDRWRNGIALYDEVMSFTFLFMDRRELGPRNPGKKFFLVDGNYDDLGLFALFQKAEAVARYAKWSGFIPVMNLRGGGNSIYQNSPEEEIWGKFFRQPEGYELDEVLESQEVYFAPAFYNGEVQTAVMNACSGSVRLSWPHGIYNDRMNAYFRERERKFLPHPDRTLGVLARGTDYAKGHFANHPIHASIERLCGKIDEVWDAWGGFDQIYLATEDADYCAYVRQRYGDRAVFTDQERYSTRPGETLPDMHRERKDRRDGFLPGAEYALSIRLLARCRSLLASGGCGGVDEALKENGGKYEHVFVFDLGGG